MKHALSILLLLVAPIAMGQELAITDNGITIAAVVSDSDIGITGPDTADPAQEVTCRITGTPTIDLSKPLVDQIDWLVGSRRMTVWLCIPEQEAVQLDVRAEMVFSAAGATLQPLVRFPVGGPGEYRVLVDWNPDPAQLVWHTLKVEGEEEGDDDPPPPPPGPLASMRVIVVEESLRRSPLQAQILLDPTLRQWLTKNGHEIRLVDKDQPSADLQKWIAQTGSALPYLFIVDPSSGGDKAVWEGPLPASQEEFRELCKRWGAEK